MSESKLVTTEDGSHSLHDMRTGETYHSIHGAVQESRHIFIERAFLHSGIQEPDILEIGFGTGLNALLTWTEAEKSGRKVSYTTVELYPLEPSIWQQLNYPALLTEQSPEAFSQLHSCAWGTFHQLSPYFSFRKLAVDFCKYQPDSQFDLVYFDAFSPEKQPELWLPERFTTLANQCKPGAILTTYCAKGIVKQALREAGFTVERLNGPPGKRHMLRGIR